MKLYKRFAAALLAGIMVLALFTACSSTPPQSPEEQEKIDFACTFWQHEACRAVERELPRNEQLRDAAQKMGEELAPKGELITNGVYWGRLDMEVPDGKQADFMVLTWDKKTAAAYDLDKLSDDVGDPVWAEDAVQKVREMMRYVLNTKDGTYSFVLGYIIAE